MADVNEKLSKAAKDGSEVKLKALLRDPCCNTLLKDKDGLTALMWAALKGHEKCTQLLLPASDISSLDNEGMTALMHASWRGYEACIRLLLPASDALVKDKYGLTALMYAASNGHEACIRLLLPASDALAKALGGRTASAWARNQEHESLAQFIDAYALAQAEQSAIGWAVSSGAQRGRPVHRV